MVPSWLSSQYSQSLQETVPKCQTPYSNLNTHSNGKICSWLSSSWKLHSRSASFGNILTLCLRAGAAGAFLNKSWSFLVRRVATKPAVFRVDCQALRRHFADTIEVSTGGDGHRTAHAFACTAGVTTDQSRRRCIGFFQMTIRAISGRSLASKPSSFS